MSDIQREKYVHILFKQRREVREGARGEREGERLGENEGYRVDGWVLRVIVVCVAKTVGALVVVAMEELREWRERERARARERE